MTNQTQNQSKNQMTNHRIIQKPLPYLLKKDVIYKVLKCPKETIIPTNDIELWKKIQTFEDNEWTQKYHDPDPNKKFFGGK